MERMTRRPPSRGRRSRGFTLLELAITLSIVGVLASVAGVQYIAFLERARTARAIVELRGIAAEIDPLGGDEGIGFPNTLAEAGITTVDPWGSPYRYLRIAVPAGMAANASELPHVSAPQDPGTSGPSAQSTDAGGDGNTVGSARKDGFLVPINSDYDLYSVGPDGESTATLRSPMSRDDVIRAADGAFYGLAEKF